MSNRTSLPSSARLRRGRQVRWSLLKERLALLAAGGRWSLHLPPDRRRDLRRLMGSGLFANASNTLVQTYLSVYLLALGAGRAEIGTLSSLSYLMMPAAMLPGGYLAARRRRYKWLVVWPMAAARLLLLLLVFLPWLPVPLSVRLVGVGIGIATLRSFLVNLATPAWTALLGKMVPLRWRGRYFSARNIVMGVGAFAVLLMVGRWSASLDEPRGYQVALATAALLGLGAAYFLARVEEPPSPALSRRSRGRRWWQRMSGGFLLFTLVGALWNFAVMVAGPFFLVYLVEETGASASALSVVSAVGLLAAVPGQRLFGLLNDQRGAGWVQKWTGLAIPFVPAIWGFLRAPWQAYPVQLFSGFIWAGYNLAAFNYLLERTPEEERASFVAFYQALAGLGMAGGAALGGWLAQVEGYRALFLTSAVLRGAAALLFAFLVAGGASHPTVQQQRRENDGKGRSTRLSRSNRSTGAGGSSGRPVRRGRDGSPLATAVGRRGRRPGVEPPHRAGRPSSSLDAAHSPLQDGHRGDDERGGDGERRRRSSEDGVESRAGTPSHPPK